MNDNISVTNIDESGDNDLCQDINNKHQIVREDISIATTDNLKVPMTESQK